MPYDIITEINGAEVHDYDSFSEQMSSLSAGDEASFTIIPYSEENGAPSEKMVILGDRYQYYLDLCEGEEACLEETETTLNSLGIEQGDAFLGVSNIRSGTVQTDRFSYIVDGRFSLGDTVVLTAVSPKCCATSKTSLFPELSHSSAVNISGNCPSNWTSTTAPITCVIFPDLLIIL